MIPKSKIYNIIYSGNEYVERDEQNNVTYSENAKDGRFNHILLKYETEELSHSYDEHSSGYYRSKTTKKIGENRYLEEIREPSFYMRFYKIIRGIKISILAYKVEGNEVKKHYIIFDNSLFKTHEEIASGKR